MAENRTKRMESVGGARYRRRCVSGWSKYFSLMSKCLY